MITENITANGCGLVALADSDSDRVWPAVSGLFWSPAAPRVIVEAYGAGDAAAAWKAWRKYLRKRPLQLTRLHDGKLSMLARGLVSPGTETRLGWLLQQLERKSPGKKTAATIAKYAEQWLHEPPAMPSDAAAVEALTWLHLLASRPVLFDGPRWWRMLEALSRIAVSPAPPLEEDAAAEQIQRGELPLTLSWLFPEVEPCAALRAAAVEALSLGMSEILDGEGLPQSRFLPAFRLLVACWTRCRLIGEAIGHTAGDGDVLQGGCWKAEAEEQFPLAVREAVRLCRADGTAVLAQVECPAASSGPHLGPLPEGVVAYSRPTATLRHGGGNRGGSGVG